MYDVCVKNVDKQVKNSVIRDKNKKYIEINFHKTQT